MSNITAALTEYRAAVRATAWAEDHGTYGDNRVKEAKKREDAAKRAVIRAATLDIP